MIQSTVRVRSNTLPQQRQEWQLVKVKTRVSEGMCDDGGGNKRGREWKDVTMDIFRRVRQRLFRFPTVEHFNNNKI